MEPNGFNWTQMDSIGVVEWNIGRNNANDDQIKYYTNKKESKRRVQNKIIINQNGNGGNGWW